MAPWCTTAHTLREQPEYSASIAQILLHRDAGACDAISSALHMHCNHRSYHRDDAMQSC